MKAETIRDYTNKKTVDWFDGPLAKRICSAIIVFAACYFAAALAWRFLS